MSHTLRVKINPGKLQQVADTFPDPCRFTRLVNAIDNEDGNAVRAELYDLHGVAGAEYIVAVLINGFGSCDEVAKLLEGPPPRRSSSGAPRR